MAVFFASRLLFLLRFPIFNDEACTTEWVQLIHQDWQTFKFIPVHNVFAAFRPPLTHWMGSVAIGFFQDPLLALRLLSVASSVIGLVSIYLFAGYFWNSAKLATWVAILWTLNPMTTFYDREFVCETYVYSFSAAAYLFTHLALTRRKLFALPAILFAAMAILSKQSGLLYTYCLVFFVALQVRRRRPGEAGPRIVVDYGNALLVGVIILASIAVYRIVIPAQYFNDFDSYNSTFVLTVPEMIRFPLDFWAANVTRIWGLYRNYYSPLALGLVLVFVVRCVKRREPRDLLVLGWFLFNSALMIVCFRYYNEYMYHTSNVIFLTLMFGVSALDVSELARRARSRAVRWLAVPGGVAALLCALWSYQLVYYYTSPKRYIEKFGTAWMNENYLRGWPSGFSIDRALSNLAKERERFVLVDPQLGNPGSAIMVYSEAYPTLRFFRFSPQLLDRLPPGSTVAIFRDSGRPLDHYLLSHALCKTREDLSEPPELPLVYCRN